MSSVVIAGNTSGTVTLNAPDIAGTTVLTLPTTSGTLVTTAGGSTVPFALGSAASPSITFTGDTNTGIFSPAADTIAFSEGGVESMRIDSSGNVGIGTSSPGVRLDVRAAGDSVMFKVQENTSGSNRRILFSNAGTVNTIGSTTGTGSTQLAFSVDDTERMRIDSSGRVTMPYQPAFRAQNSPASVGGGGPAGGTAITYGTVIFNTGSYYNNTTGRFTAPVSGVYYFASSGYWLNQGVASLAFYKNGGRINETYESEMGGNVCLTYCNAGDYVISTFGSPPGSYSGTGDYWSFEGYLIG